MFKFTIIASAAVLLYSAAAQSATSQPAGCLFTNEKCACRKKIDQTGICLRNVPGTSYECEVDTCQPGGYVCDCAGNETCERVPCTTWKTLTPSEPLVVGQSVNCEQENPNNRSCLRPIEYKMVQIGTNKYDMFNMTIVNDTAGLGNGKNMVNAWPDVAALKSRFINIRLVRTADGLVNLCSIYNDYFQPDDGLGFMAVKSIVSGVAGQTLDITACDDLGECPPNLSASTHSFSHFLYSNRSDGWCVKPLAWNGDAVSLKFFDIERLKGIIFHGADSTTGGEYAFQDLIAASAATGTLDSNGLVTGGAIVEITFNLNGILV